MQQSKLMKLYTDDSEMDQQLLQTT